MSYKENMIICLVGNSKISSQACKICMSGKLMNSGVVNLKFKDESNQNTFYKFFTCAVNKNNIWEGRGRANNIPENN